MKQIKENAKTKMEKAINVMLSDFAGIRAGRANPSVLNKVQVEYYGAMTPVTQIGRFLRKTLIFAGKEAGKTGLLRIRGVEIHKKQ